MLAEFETSGQLAAAIVAMRKLGYRRLESYTPYHVPEVEDALARPRSKLPYAIFAVGILAAGGAYFLQWFVDDYLYPINVGGRPPHFPLSFVPITFEMGVLFASFTAFFGVLALAKMLRLWNPVFEIDGFESASIDHFWLQIEAEDEKFDAQQTGRELAELRPLRVVNLGGTAS